MEENMGRKAKTREKNCVICDKAYIDTTKRNVGKTCSKQCAYVFGVSQRHAKGSYERTEEQNRKMVEAMQKIREAGGCQISDEKKKLLSEKLKKSWASGEQAKKQKKTCIEKYGVEHHMKLPEFRNLTKIRQTGRKISEQTRKKYSEHARRQNHRFSRCRGGIRNDLNTYFRSSWEANYARYLNYINLSWEYEPTTFDLGEGYTYTPDFKLNDGSYIELKGWLTEQGKIKLERFKKIYPYVKLVLISQTDYRSLYKEYRDIIPNWEKVST
jgi:hypothetical protein